MNKKQTKKAIVLSFIGAYLLLILPMIISQMNKTMYYNGVNHPITLDITISNMMLSALILSLLIALIYSDNISKWFKENTKIGKWVNTPANSYKK